MMIELISFNFLRLFIILHNVKKAELLILALTHMKEPNYVNIFSSGQTTYFNLYKLTSNFQFLHEFQPHIIYFGS